MYEYQATVLRVIDGDTIEVDIDLGFSTIIKKRSVRLKGIDTPETRTRDLVEKEAGLRAKDRVEGLCPPGSVITLRTTIDKGDKYGRILGEIFVTGVVQSVNQLLLEEGHAVVY